MVVKGEAALSTTRVVVAGVVAGLGRKESGIWWLGDDGGVGFGLVHTSMLPAFETSP